MLYKNLRVAQIFGSNTDVGKTVFSTALCRASLAAGENVAYLKPVGTGNLVEGGDDGHVSKFAKGKGTLVTDCLFRFQTPVSPHLAIQRDAPSDQPTPPSDQVFADAIEGYMTRQAAAGSTDALYIETAGGVHSPTLNGSSQADAFRPLRLPTILVASPHLGGISTTMSAYESLLLRGYDIDAVLCFQEDYYENWKYLQEAFTKRDQRIRFATVKPPPEKEAHTSRDADEQHMERYYQRICKQEDSLPSLVEHLKSRHVQRIDQLQSAGKRARESIWWPFLQHAHLKSDKDITVIDSAYRDAFYTLSHDAAPGKTLVQRTFDGSASWWTQCLGHARQELNLAAAHAAGRYGHVIFPQAVHEPALELAERLVSQVGKGWASKAFFTDDGSTGMEVALKMALRAFSKRNNVEPDKRKELGIIGLKGSYHGDTIGAMDAAEASVYSRTVEWHRGRGFWFDPPQVFISQGKAVVRLEGEQFAGSQSVVNFDSLSDVYDVEGRLDSKLAAFYREHILFTLSERQSMEDPITFGALVLEPTVMGAGGMIFVDPLFQRVLVDTVRSKAAVSVLSRPGIAIESTDVDSWSNLPVVYDEVFSGLHRVGPLSGAELLGCNPDISCYAKILTGGLLPMSVTLASSSIYNVFLGPQKTDALLHGHSYTAYPMGCAVANKTLDMLQQLDFKYQKLDWLRAPRGGKIWSMWKHDAVRAISDLPTVDGVMAMGTVLSIQLKVDPTSAGYQSSAGASLLAQVQHHLADAGAFGLHCRTLGDVLYLMSALDTPSDTLRTLERAVLKALSG